MCFNPLFQPSCDSEIPKYPSSFVPPCDSGLRLPRVGRQVVNIPSFTVRVDSQKHIDFSLTSPFRGGRPGRVKRRNQKAAAKKSGGDGDEDDEE